MKLDIYYYIDFCIDQNLTLLNNILNRFLNDNGYTINNLVNYNLNDTGNTKDTSIDPVKNGVLIFDRMFESLKLKNSNETWFLYICNETNNFIILLKKIPYEKKCYYVINKEPLYMYKSENTEMTLRTFAKFQIILRKLITFKTFFTY